MLEVGTLLKGRYQVQRRLGGFGRAHVYLVTVDGGDAPMALHETRFETGEPEEWELIRAQLEREGVRLMALRHPHLAAIRDCFSEQRAHYVVRDYLQGDRLLDLLLRDATGLPWEDVCAWADDICDALIYLHAQTPPVIFRDVRPGNVLLDDDGNVRLFDFRLARILDPLSSDLEEFEGMIGYAPWEQHLGEEPDARCDVYALGATLYHLLSGTVPPSSTARFQEKQSLPPLRIAPVPIAMVVHKMMAIAPDDRYPTAEAARAALAQAVKAARARPAVPAPPLEPIAPPEQTSADHRRAERTASTFRVMSRDLPGYKALAHDLSDTGMQLVLDEPVLTDDILDLQLDFDDDLDPIRCRARVVWCRHRNGAWAVGLAFEALPKPALETLRTYLKHVRRQ